MKKIKTLIAAAVLGLGVTVSSISPAAPESATATRRTPRSRPNLAHAARTFIKATLTRSHSLLTKIVSFFAQKGKLRQFIFKNRS